jgi:5'(3')-deoxyribonucleotidase
LSLSAEVDTKMTNNEQVDRAPRFVLGLDLDGTCADFYGRMREIAAEWAGRPVDDLTADPDWGLTSWGLLEGEYERLHRFAVTQRDLFESMKPIPGAPQALRRLGTEGIRIRIITHRLFIRHFHETAVAQTVRWLDNYGVPYWDLCFMRRKGDVGADLYVEDSPVNIADLRAGDHDVLVLSNAANRHVPDGPGGRADNWEQAELAIRDRYYAWLDDHGLARPAGIGLEPAWAEDADANPTSA